MSDTQTISSNTLRPLIDAIRLQYRTTVNPPHGGFLDDMIGRLSKYPDCAFIRTLSEIKNKEKAFCEAYAFGLIHYLLGISIQYSRASTIVYDSQAYPVSDVESALATALRYIAARADFYKPAPYRIRSDGMDLETLAHRVGDPRRRRSPNLPEYENYTWRHNDLCHVGLKSVTNAPVIERIAIVSWDERVTLEGDIFRHILSLTTAPKYELMDVPENRRELLNRQMNRLSWLTFTDLAYDH